MNLKVSIQGAFGSYSYVTAKNLFDEETPLLFRKQFAEVFSDVETGKAEYALLPFRNNITGAINDTFRLLYLHGLTVVREIETPLDHTLMALKKIPVKNLKYIYSHPQALHQCSNFLNRSIPSDCSVREVHDTAGAKEYLFREPENSALIASGKMAKMLGLVKIKYPVQNFAGNTTNFLLLSGKGNKAGSAGSQFFIACKTESVDGVLRKIIGFPKGQKIEQIFQIVLTPGDNAVFIRIRIINKEAISLLSNLKKIKGITYFSGLF